MEERTNGAARKDHKKKHESRLDGRIESRGVRIEGTGAKVRKGGNCRGDSKIWGGEKRRKRAGLKVTEQGEKLSDLQEARRLGS